MPIRRRQEDTSSWTLSLTEGPHCSVGYSPNEAMNRDGSTSPGRPNEDRYYTCIFRDSIELYMVLDGHDGTRAVNFSRSSIPHILLNSSFEGGPGRIMDDIKNSIISTEREFFIGIDPHITRKVTLQLEIEQKVPDVDSSVALKLFPTQIAEIGRLDEQIKGGTTAVVALIHNSVLYVANVGDSRAILCSQNHDGTITSVQQLSVDHNTTNENELRRLESCGLDRNKLKKAKRLGMQQNTRSIGDFFIKGGYQSVDVISHATEEPGTAEPYVNEPISISGFYGFLLLMSDGLYEAYEAWTKRPDHINDDIAHLVSQEMKKCEDIRIVAQNVVDKVKYLYYDTCRKGRRSGRLDDITLIIKNIGKSPFIRMQSSGPGHIMSPSRVREPLPPTAPITTKQFDFTPTLYQQQQPLVAGGYQNYPPQDFNHPGAPRYTPHPDYGRQQGLRDVPDTGGSVYNRRQQEFVSSNQQQQHQSSSQQFQGVDKVEGFRDVPDTGGSVYNRRQQEFVSSNQQQQHQSSSQQFQGVDKVAQIKQDPPSSRYQPKNPTSNIRNETNLGISDPASPGPRMEPSESVSHSVLFRSTQRRESSSSISSSDTERLSMSTITENISDKDLYGWSLEENPDSAAAVVDHLSTLNPDDDSSAIVGTTEEEESKGVEREEGSGDSDFVYESSPEEEEEEVPDGNGNIHSYISFSKNFPLDISWNDIKIV